MKRRKSKGATGKIAEVQKWFKEAVTYKGEPYVMDAEQVAAVIAEDKNAIVVARAGSGKTRTIVAKIVYLVARCEVKPEEIMAFVFNANAAREINERLGEMRVEGKPIMGEVLAEGGSVMGRAPAEECQVTDGMKVKGRVKVAWTFHAFARHIIYNIYSGSKKCGKILAGEKEKFVARIVRGMVREGMEEGEFQRLVGQMAQFVNRAQQKYLGGEVTVGEVAEKYLANEELTERERKFVEMGVECFRRYHWRLLDTGLKGFEEYGTDFNLIVSWASKIIEGGGSEVERLLGGKRYILIDEYQDFSQLFLSVVMAIRKVIPEVRLFVVGDDWQAINRFAGSDVEYFKEFEKFFTPAKRYEITTNYRCNYAIVDIARKFMKKAMGEKGEFKAFARKAGKVVIVNPRETECKVAMVEGDPRVGGRDLVYMEMARKMVGRLPKLRTVRYAKTLVQVMRKNKKAEGIMLLHRNNETNLEGMSLGDMARGLKWGLEELGVMSGEEFEEKVQMMTMHKSKGLEAEVVILLEADEGVIPKMHPDTLLYGMFGETEEVALMDQKRLFYVAMTRAKKRLYIMHDSASGVGFVKYLGWGVERWE